VITPLDEYNEFMNRQGARGLREVEFDAEGHIIKVC
jgi:hypothetical protein